MRPTKWLTSIKKEATLWINNASRGIDFLGSETAQVEPVNDDKYKARRVPEQARKANLGQQADTGV